MNSVRGTLTDEYVSITVDEDRIARLVLCHPGERYNILDREMLSRLESAVSVLERLSDPAGIIITGGFGKGFVAGADIKEIARITDPEEARKLVVWGRHIMERIAQLPVPTVAAVNGACLGGGFEMALACRFRVAVRGAETQIGLPEVNLGIIPGFGGIPRLSRLIGLIPSLPLLLTGTILGADDARRKGLVDVVVPPHALMTTARDIVLGRLAVRRRKRKLLHRLLEFFPPTRALILRGARKKVLRTTGGHYPAPLRLLDVIGKRETEAVADLACGSICKNLIALFFLREKYRKSQEERPVGKVGVLGAGTMGGGIAQIFSRHGIRVRLRDVRGEALGTALRTAHGLFDNLRRRGTISPREADRSMGLISPTTTMTGMVRCGLIIEAVPENLDLKRELFRDLSRRVPPETILASNTSSLSITAMAEDADHPERVVGMHFFNPVHRMPLVEVIAGRRTSPETVAATVAIARRLGKIPIVVRDAPGFLVNRILGAYLGGSTALLREGVPMEEIERCMTRFGMPMPPFRLMDEIGLDVCVHAGRVLAEAFPGIMPEPVIPGALVEDGRFLGRKKGAGFYRYGGKRPVVNDDAVRLLHPLLWDPGREVGDDEIKDRLILTMVNEASRCLGERIIESPTDVDVGMVMGTGFPPFRGGLLRYADAFEIPRVVSRLVELGVAPSSLLKRMVEERTTFFGGSGNA